MRFGTAIERLVDNYEYAKSKIWIRDKVAWALYHTWKEADRKTENSSEKPNNCANCKHLKKHNGKLADYVCDRKGSIVTNPYDKECDEMWEPKDEPQTEAWQEPFETMVERG